MVCAFESMWGKGSTCSEARAEKWRKMKKKSFARLPADEDTLHHHLDRVNYLFYLLKHYELNLHPSPKGHGWERRNEKFCPV